MQVMKHKDRHGSVYLVTLTTDVNVGFYEHEQEWYALAREFDIVGTGRTQFEAFRQLQELVSDYIEVCIQEAASEIFSPQEPEDWALTEGNRECYVVTLFYKQSSQTRPYPRRRIQPENIHKLATYRGAFIRASLTESPCAAI